MGGTARSMALRPAHIYVLYYRGAMDGVHFFLAEYRDWWFPMAQANYRSNTLVDALDSDWNGDFIVIIRPLDVKRAILDLAAW